MLTNTELKIKAFEILIKALGELDTERFIKTIIKESGDYTLWQQTYFKPTESVREISRQAMQHRKKA